MLAQTRIELRLLGLDREILLDRRGGRIQQTDINREFCDNYCILRAGKSTLQYVFLCTCHVCFSEIQQSLNKRGGKTAVKKLKGYNFSSSFLCGNNENCMSVVIQIQSSEQRYEQCSNVSINHTRKEELKGRYSILKTPERCVQTEGEANVHLFTIYLHKLAHQNVSAVVFLFIQQTFAVHQLATDQPRLISLWYFPSVWDFHEFAEVGAFFYSQRMLLGYVHIASKNLPSV